MATVAEPSRSASWLTAADEFPHESGTDPLWTENWLTYAWAPEASTGVYFHVCRRPDPMPLYDYVFHVCLPGDRLLSARGVTPAREGGGPVAGPVTFSCVDPFRKWRNQFDGAGRPVTVADLWAGPLPDGPLVDVALDMTIEAMSPPFDYGAQHLEQSWGTGHYEQHHSMTGTLTVDGVKTRLEGTGLRDHSWGPRDWSGIGTTTWYHGQFTGSGRSFMVISVPGRPPFEPFLYGVLSDRDAVRPVKVSSIPEVEKVYQPGGAYEIALEAQDGDVVIAAEVLHSIPMTFLAPSEIGLGISRSPQATHDNVENMTRFEWDGEVGYGLVTGCRERDPATRTSSS